MSLNVKEIEQHLRDLWKGFSVQDRKGQAVTKAQVMNLIAYTAKKDSEPEIIQVMADVSETSPGRMIVLLRDEELPPSTMNSWVNALCHLASGGRRQVCCEQIVVHAGERDPFQWSSIALALVVPNVPVFLWWNDSVAADPPLLNAILEACDRLIIDSALSDDFQMIADVMTQHGNWLAVSDLNWARLTPWRHAVAGFYDHLACGKRLQNIEQIEMTMESDSNASGQALLFLAWFASCLGWTVGPDGLLHTNEARKVSIRLDHIGGSSNELAGVQMISPDGSYSVVRGKETAYLEAEIKLKNRPPSRNLIRLPRQTVSGFISNEVSILGHDHIYEKAVSFLTTFAPLR